VADGLGNAHFTVWKRAPKIEVIDHAIGGGHEVGDFLGLIRRHVQHLHPSASDFNLVVMPIAVPFLERDMSAGEFLGVDPLHLDKVGVGLDGVVNQALNLWVGSHHLAVMVVRPHLFAVH